MLLSLFPAFIKVYEERATIRQESTAYYAIDASIQSWLYENQVQVTGGEFEKGGTFFEWSIFQITDRELKLCLSWSGKNGREYEKCGFAKK